MSKRSTSRTESLVPSLGRLYGNTGAREVVREIDGLLDQYRGVAKSSAGGTGLSEKDVLLITYGDTLKDGATSPLHVLHRFYNNYLGDVFSVVHILPFHPYSSDDGFSVIDYHAVRDDLGTWSDIGNLASDCRLMADAVVNHMSSQSPWFKQFLAGDDAFGGFFFESDPSEDLSAVVRPRTSPLLTRFTDANGQDRHVWTTFSADQVDLNYRNPAVLVAVIDVLFYLVSKGARLLRLDAVTFLWKQAGTSSANLEETHLLIKIMRAAISMLRDDVVVITETNVPHRENVAYFGDGHDEAHMVYNFALPPLIAYSFINGNSRHLSEWASQLELPSEDVCFLNFSSSHDGVGVRPVEEILDENELQRLVDAARGANGLVSSRALEDGKEHPYELNCTYIDLISSPGDNDETLISRFVASQAIVLAMPGVPAIYIQSLLGTRNDLDLLAQTGRARSINRSQHEYGDIVNALSDPERVEAKVFDRLTAMIRKRRQHVAFSPYAPFEVWNLGEQVFALRRGDGKAGANILCIVNLTGREALVEVPAEAAGKDILSGDRVPAGECRLEPFAVRWLLSEQQQN